MPPRRKHSSKGRWFARGGVGPVVGGLLLAMAGPASASVTPTASAGVVVHAAEQDSSAGRFGGAFVTRPPYGNPTGTSTTATSYFGGEYAVLTTGDATIAHSPNSNGYSGSYDGGSVRGAYDVTVLAINFAIPDAGSLPPIPDVDDVLRSNDPVPWSAVEPPVDPDVVTLGYPSVDVTDCMLAFDYQFLSEEYPEWVGTAYNDAFVVELDATTWTVANGSVTTTSGIAMESVNSATMGAGNASGTTYDGATSRRKVRIGINRGVHTLYLSLFDVGDGIYDSSVFVDGLRFSCGSDNLPVFVPQILKLKANPDAGLAVRVRTP